MLSDAPNPELERARKYVLDQVARAAQATFPLGRVVVVRNLVLSHIQMVPWEEQRQGSIEVAAGDPNRPYHPAEIARTATAHLDRLGWDTSTSEHGFGSVVEASRSGFTVTVSCPTEEQLTAWKATTPMFPVQREGFP